MRSSPCLGFCQRILWLVSPSLFPLVLPFHTLEDIPEQERPSIGSMATQLALKREQSPAISSTAQKLSHLSLPARHRLSICFHSSKILTPTNGRHRTNCNSIHRLRNYMLFNIHLAKFAFQSVWHVTVRQMQGCRLWIKHALTCQHCHWTPACMFQNCLTVISAAQLAWGTTNKSDGVISVSR